MKLSEVLVKPVLTEKANAQQDKLRRYAFKVSRKANKLEIKKAVEEFYGVSVINVNTSVVPGKAKSRFTKKGVVNGRKPAYKKAFITVAEGENIDLYANIQFPFPQRNMGGGYKSSLFNMVISADKA